MESATQSLVQELPEPGFFSSQSVLDILKLILDGSELSEVLAVIAGLVESQGKGTLCTIWLPDTDGKHVYCAAAPGLPGFAARAGRMSIGPKGASCGTAIYRKEPVYVADILQESIWDDYRDRVLPFGIRAVWSRPLFTREGTVLGTFAIHYREVRSPDATDLKWIESASYIAGIAIERHLHQEVLRHERDRLRLLLEITSSVTSRLDFRQVVEALSTNLFRVMQCDVSALLLPDADSGDLRVTILYNPDARGPMREGSLVLGPAMYSGFWDVIWIYFTAPPLGMMLAAEGFLAAREGKGPPCAKLHHHNDKRCIFCGSSATRWQDGEPRPSVPTS